MTSLRGEIAEKDAQALSLARWKLAVVAAVCVAGLGWGATDPQPLTGTLILYSVGYVCCYLDVLIYRRLLMIHVLSRYLREYVGVDESITEEKQYELHVNRARSSFIIPLSERWGHFMSSIVFSVGPAFLGVLKYGLPAHGGQWALPEPAWLLLLPGSSLFLTLLIFGVFERARRRLKG